ncbi:Uncharacterized 2Fe-2 and 4Fe-4S clusters-containing protein, contains DUF4445 domain [Acetitomaculum ruminis DSM 5522]|uniref:Uncharacterized 2Fe-2 and 4Fe-4S clusters-containing protein, contains DUF4445 domain n=1 Tax=Acetitomaculum ruminis DSM 5522 TaxID=1120918 RepID=A0A1I0XLR3_9FIRM|nr:ASKHA domain-containing protein [Acetitomaculum ruminis]SFB01844.1 Uncharacterized 2Fe-2 and 4Fe-4S clusters-containing protein, contains DUF4445 domain [Acetitomaculum ruminis DSM 5522]
MSQFNVVFMPQRLSVTVEEGTNLLDAQIKAGLIPDAPCGGKGTCGKCLVNVLKGGNETGVVKACQTLVTDDMEVDIINVPKGYHLLTTGIERQIDFLPLIKSFNISVEKCEMGDSRSDWKRLKKAVSEVSGIDEKDIPLNINLVKELNGLLKECNYIVNVVMYKNEILQIRKEDGPVYIMAFDIGTTSVVGYLLDGKNGKEIAVDSMLNPQSQYGADVIQRSNYSMENSVEPLTIAIRNAMKKLVENNCKKAKINPCDIYLVNIVGNTCMHHLFMGIVPSALVLAPYNPSVSEPVIDNVNSYDLGVNPNGKLQVLSNIAGFVGADTVGVLVATGFDRIDKLTLAIDIGTNGEMVLGNKQRAITCSTAAGPAFEGAKIECGMRGSAGAIDHLKVEGKRIVYSVIGDEKPIGICGSGLMDIVSIMLENGIVDESGRILDQDEMETDVAKENAFRIVPNGNNKHFVLATKEESGEGKAVYISQKDVREVQLAKGAMAAGIELMSKQLGIDISQIEQVMIAGAFGNYMSPHSACAIGLIPKELEKKIIPIGNAAGEGSKIASLNVEEFNRSVAMAEKIEFLELATDPDFQDTFVDQLEFPEY